MVEINQSPILLEFLGAGTDGNRRGVDDVTEHASVLVQNLSTSFPPSSTCPQTPGARQLPWRPHPSSPSTASPNAASTFLYRSTKISSCRISCMHHGLEGIWVGFAAEDKNLMRLAGWLAAPSCVCRARYGVRSAGEGRGGRSGGRPGCFGHRGTEHRCPRSEEW